MSPIKPTRIHASELRGLRALDNPEWAVKIDIAETAMEGVAFSDLQVMRSPTDWIRCRVADFEFIAFGRPGNLREMISIFLEWSRSLGAGTVHSDGGP